MNLRKELAAKNGTVASFRIGQHCESESREAQNMDLSPRSDFEEELATLKECLADVLEENSSLEQNDYPSVMIKRVAQTNTEVEGGRHIIPVNGDDDEETVKRDHCNLTNKCYSIARERTWMSKSISEIWRLRAELAFLKKQIKDKEIGSKCLLEHNRVLLAAVQESQEILDLIKKTERGMKSNTFEPEERLNSFEKQMEKLKAQLINVECREQYKDEVEERDLDIANLKKDIENLEDDMRSGDKRLHENIFLAERSKVMEFESKNLDECSSLKAKLIKLNGQIIEMKNEGARKHFEEAKDLKQQLDKAHQAYELSEIEIDRLRKESKNLSEEMNHLKNLLNTASMEKEQLRAEALDQLKEVERLSR